MTEKANILIIDDEEIIRDSCSQVLQKDGYAVRTARDGREGLEAFKKEVFHLVLLDIKLPGMNGLQLLGELKKENPDTPVIMITGYASVESAVETMRLGAFDYMTKPFSPKELRVHVSKALQNRNLILENIYLKQELEARSEFDMVVGDSKAMAKVLDIVKSVSPSDSTVLITGESGTGKELLAHEIHRHSLRCNNPFVVVDCGALVETLFESELFGHVKGSFTGAHETKHGRFEVASGGTIFLDEISNISLNIQAKLLRVIQEREVTRVGSNKPIKVDVRIIAATNQQLSDVVMKGKFREDLFYRLSVVPIDLPPLRERREDIPELVSHFLRKYNKRAKKNVLEVSPRVLKVLANYDWPGNIRELENTIERAIVLSKGNRINLDALMYYGLSVRPASMFTNGTGFRSLEQIERDYIKSVLQAQLGNKSKTADILGIDRKTLQAKIKKYGLL